jgi:hypothetical protein
MTTTLLAAAALAVATNGDWHTLLPSEDRAQLPAQINVEAGTATVAIQGRVSDDDPPITLLTGSATAGALIPAFPQMRAIVTGPAGATVSARVGAVLARQTRVQVDAPPATAPVGPNPGSVVESVALEPATLTLSLSGS